MTRFITVIHGWHVSSNGFDVHELKALNIYEANKEACWLSTQRDRTFDRCAYTVIELKPGERIERPLTWRERLTGRIS